MYHAFSFTSEYSLALNGQINGMLANEPAGSEQKRAKQVCGLLYNDSIMSEPVLSCKLHLFTYRHMFEDSIQDNKRFVSAKMCYKI